MDATLNTMMNMRLHLTKISDENSINNEEPDGNEETESDDEPDSDSSEISETNEPDNNEETDSDDKPDSDTADESETNEEIDGNSKKKGNHDPPITFKEHFLSHFFRNIRNLGPLPLTNTGSKI